MRQIEALLAEYGQSHQNAINVAIHAIAVPGIYFVTLGLIWSLPVPAILAQFELSWAHLLAIPVLMYYFKLSGAIGAGMSLLTLLSAYGIALLDTLSMPVWQSCLGLFVVFWIMQFVGHLIEGKKPSFFKDIQFLLVGPAWWWCHFLKRLNISY